MNRCRIEETRALASVVLAGLAGLVMLGEAAAENRHTVVSVSLCESGLCEPAQLRVWDGDTFIVDRGDGAGEKIRIANIDTPEIEGRCSSESAAAIAAKDYLARLLDGQAVDLIRDRLDKYGRQLAAVSTSSGDVGEMIIRAGLARRWEGHRDPWC